jgi:hypothetical protein
LVVVVAIAVGATAGLVGRQVTRSDAAAATRDLAQRYVAEGFWTVRQVAMFAPNAKFVDATDGTYGQGHGQFPPDATSLYRGSIEDFMYTHHEIPWSGTERLVVAGTDGFVTAWTMHGPYNCRGDEPFTLHGVSVSRVQNGRITLQTFYYDPRPMRGS